MNRKRVLRVMRERGTAGALTSPAGATAQAMGPRGSMSTESELAVRQNEDLGRTPWSGGLILGSQPDAGH